MFESNKKLKWTETQITKKIIIQFVTFFSISSMIWDPIEAQ
jgi:hypothetical protein